MPLPLLSPNQLLSQLQQKPASMAQPKPSRRHKNSSSLATGRSHQIRQHSRPRAQHRNPLPLKMPLGSPLGHMPVDTAIDYAGLEERKRPHSHSE